MNPHNKYGAVKTKVDGITFDSKHEAERYIVLKEMERDGEISKLELQKKFVLFPRQTDPLTGKTIEHECYYKADFVYRDADGNEVVEDAKGNETEAYKIKRKAMLYLHGIRIVQV